MPPDRHLWAGGSGNIKNMLITPVSEIYIVGIGLKPDGNLGQARLALRRLSAELMEIL